MAPPPRTIPDECLEHPSDEPGAEMSDIAENASLHLPEEASLITPLDPVRVGVLVLGSSGRPDIRGAHVLARHGAHAMALQWFGGHDQPPGVCEIPIEVFVRALDRLQREDVDRLAVIGVSKGAEAALLLACVDDRVALTVAMSPTSVVWANVGAGIDGEVTPYRSSWTWRAEPLPFVPYVESWVPAEAAGPVAFRTLYEQSLLADRQASEAAAIPVEQAKSDLILGAGHDDALWPSVEFASALVERRVAHKRQVELISHEHAGHSQVFPGQPIPPPSEHVKSGGTPEGDAELGASLWAAVVQLLGLHE